MLSRLSAGNRRSSVWVRLCAAMCAGLFGAGRFALAACLGMAMLSAAVSPSAKAQEEDFLDPAEAFVMSAAMANPTELHVHFRIAPDYYMYRQRFGFETDAPVAGEPIFPRGTVKYDPTFDEDMEVYHDQVTIRLPLQAGASQPLPLRITGQGCADAGLCYPPMTFTLQLVPAEQGYAVRGDGVLQSVPPPRDEVPGQAGRAGQDASSAGNGGLNGVLGLGDTGLASYLAGIGWIELVGLALLFGVLLTFTPCVLPMVPIVLAVVAGDAGRDGRSSRWRGLGLAACYVLGMSVVYTVLGVAAGLVGASLAAWLQTPWVLATFAVLLALLALAMFDVYTFQAPAGLQARLSERAARIPGGRWGGAFLIGMVSALIVGPCVAAPLAGVLLFISQTGDVVLGGSALFAMAWGQGLLLLVLGATSGALMPRSGPWMDGVKQFFGMLLLATAWWMVQPVAPAWLGMLGWAFIGLCSAALLGVFGGAKTETPSGARALWRGVLRAVGVLLAVWSVLLLVGLAGGARDLLRPLAPFAATAVGSSSGGAGASMPAGEAPEFTRVGSVAELDRLLAESDRPVMLDFYADWCVSCIEMERFTFSEPQVAERMSNFLLLQADVTANTPDDRELLRRFSLFGPPGIIFFDRRGRELDQRVVGFQNAARFGAVLDEVMQKAG
ncbi:protein-disulfide reductase DsbD [Pusillimonas caeni]|uniref:protein-disulfide reductase DsbD n=1 Tax=Pusillimonas caeni TaxID=1348472 RepID=UPI000E59BCD8|nr:protein-disulfide reductase DsbD [Pusillimonas caeni]TFL14664.1 protein-disulfide reductase DsbD [Pusillimonas caeni]